MAEVQSAGRRWDASGGDIWGNRNEGRLGNAPVERFSPECAERLGRPENVSVERFSPKCAPVSTAVGRCPC